MKNTNTCPKCASKEIIRIPGKHTGFGAGNIIIVGQTAIKPVLVTRFVCEACGFSEEWIESTSDIERIKKRYK
ncbi:MAG: hypothetical protein ACOCUE_01410 [Candidatus Izemoplasmataceae bacterium]